MENNTQNHFQPTEEQLRNAENLLIAMAHESLVREVVEAYETKILERHQFKIARKWIELGINDEVILERKKSFLLEDHDYQTFIAETIIERDAANLKVSRPDNDPLLEAESLRRNAENTLLDSLVKTDPFSKLGSMENVPYDLKGQILNIALGLLAPYLGNSEAILERLRVQKSESLPINIGEVSGVKGSAQ